MKKTIIAALLTATTILGVSYAATNNNYPSHDIKLIIPFAPGGATDVVFRIISESAEKQLGKPIVPTNMSGAGGSKGSIFVKGSRPDGYTLLGGHEFLLTTNYGGMVPFGLEAFEPVCLLDLTPLTINAGTHTPYKTLGEMLKYAKSNPGKVVVTMSPASVGYVIWKELTEKSGLDIDKDFRIVVINGVGPQTKAVLGGHADVYAGDLPSDAGYEKDGRIRFLGIAHNDRLEQAPNLPTLKEAGVDVNIAVSRAIFAPKGTPKEVINKIAFAYKTACEDSSVKKKITDMGSIIQYLGPKETAEYFTKQETIYKKDLSSR